MVEVVILILTLIGILSLLTALVSTRLAALFFLWGRARRAGVKLVICTLGNTGRTSQTFQDDGGGGPEKSHSGNEGALEMPL